MIKEVIDKMFNDSSESHVAKIFTDYRSENNYLLTKFKNILKYIEKLRKEENIEKREVLGSPILNWNSNLSGLYDGLNLNINRIKEIVNKLVECLEKEKKELDSYVSKLKQSTITSQTHLEQLLISYNNEQYDYMQQLNTLIPGIIEEFDKAIGMEDETAKSTAGSLLGNYNKLANAILNKNISKDDLYLIVEEVLEKLFTHKKYLSEIKDKENNLNFNKFIRNLQGITALEKELKKWKAKAGRDKDTEKLYSELEEEKDKKKLDKFMQEKLKALFDDIRLGEGENEKDAEKHIEDRIKVDYDINELKDKWEQLLQEFPEQLSAKGYYFKTKDPITSTKATGIADFKFPLENGDTKTVADIRKESPQENDLRYIVIKLQTALGQRGKKKAQEKTFKELVDLNTELFKESKKEQEEDEETTKEFKDGYKFDGDASQIKDFTEEAVNNILSETGIEGVRTLLDNTEDGTEIDQEALKSYKTYIIKELKTIGKNLNTYRENEKTSWDEDRYKRHIKELKTLIKEWKGDISNKNKVKALCDNTEHELKQIIQY